VTVLVVVEVVLEIPEVAVDAIVVERVAQQQSTASTAEKMA